MPSTSERFRPKRRFGQNFLVNQGAIDRIIAAFGAAPGDLVLEIGPGDGALTRRLLGRVARIGVVEIDRDLVARLRERLVPEAAPGTLLVVEGDILELDLAGLLADLGASAGRPARVIANLPYNIATAVILRLLERHPVVQDLMVMVQREVAARILSPPGSRSYGSLSVLCQASSHVESVLRLRPGSFRPRPKVESEVIRLSPRESGALHDAGPVHDAGALARLLRVCFGHRRKTLLNNLAGVSPAGQAEVLIRRAGLDPKARPETVPVEGYLALLAVWEKEAGL